MPALTSLPFYKMHGLGNDFMVVDARSQPNPITPAITRLLADRHRGVGFDQLVVMLPGSSHRVAADLAFWNADGSVAEACGNATRCAAALLLQETTSETLVLRVHHRLLPCRAVPHGIQVNMGQPKLAWQDIPLAEASHTERIDVKLGPIDNPALWGPSAVNMGNPHCVFYVDNADAVPVAKLGAFVENHPMFPQGANVSFAQVLQPDQIRLRVWERGAGETLACGSAACAAVVAGVRRRLIQRQSRVILDGGALDIVWQQIDNCVCMTGPAELVYVGAVDGRLLALSS